MKDFVEERINIFLGVLEKLVVKESTEITGFMYKECGYEKLNQLPVIDDSFKEFVPNRDRWAGKLDSHAWFYKEIDNPYNEGLLEISSDSNIQKWDAINPQFIVYVDGAISQAIDLNHRDIYLTKGKHEIYLYAYGSSLLKEYVDFFANLKLIDEKTKEIFYDIKVPYELLSLEEGNTYNYAQVKEHLNAAVNLIDVKDPYSKEYYESLERAKKYLDNEFYGKLCGKNDVEEICIGHTHIDVAWEWTLSQTREKTVRSFSNVLTLMKRYPEYKFMSSQPQLYKFLKQEAPEVYEQVKQMIKEGRWEVEGGMWLEADCNLSSGESLVRQFLYGKRFIKEEFGVDSKVLWLPDVFGYSAALPQICKKSGVDYFVTSKISWNEFNKLPYDVFNWFGLDGTKILTYFLTAQDYVRGKEPKNYTTYNAILSPKQTLGTYDRFQQKNILDEVLMTFGYGDGGGGPVEVDLENQRRLEKGLPGIPKTRIEFAKKFLDEVKEKVENNPHLPSWFGELYLEFHRGTYTSQAKNKLYNRKSEFLYETAETLSLLSEGLTGNKYRKEEMMAAWEIILLNQFHDIIPGSSIHDVYVESHKQYESIIKNGEDIVRQDLHALATNVNKKGVLVYNPLSFERSDAVRFNDKYYYVENVPSKGYKVIDLSEEENHVRISTRELENDFFDIVIDDTGALISIYDKRNNREVLKDKGNVLRVFEDYPKEYDNWEVSPYHLEKHWDIVDVVSMSEVYENERSGLRITKKFLNSTITQTIYLYNHIDRIDFVSDVDWKENHLLLKALFPVNVSNTKATYDVQFGSVERPTHYNTSWDKAKFEVCAHKYSDLSEYGYGVSLMNDCKYGHSVYDGTMTISLIKCGTFPDPEADKCEHHFTYSLYPHKGNNIDASTIKRAYELNIPILAIETDGSGSLASEYSMLSVDKDSVVVETMKKAEDNDDIIIRAYECFGGRSECNFKLGFDIKEAYLCDLLENKIKELPIVDNSVSVDFTPFDIETIRVTKK